MREFHQEEFNTFVLDNDVVGFFENPITLKSGRQSNWYVNWRNPTGDAYLLNGLAEHVMAFIKSLNLNPNCFYGVPEGATKLGVVTSLKWALEAECDLGSHAIPMGRGKPKEHGDPKDRYFVGAPKGKVVVLEDVTTTGGSLLTTLDQLTEAGADVVAAVGLTNRMELRDDGTSVKEAVNYKGFEYLAMSSALELLPEAYRRLQPGEDIGRAIEAEFKKYGVEPLKLLEG